MFSQFIELELNLHFGHGLVPDCSIICVVYGRTMSQSMTPVWFGRTRSRMAWSLSWSPGSLHPRR